MAQKCILHKNIIFPWNFYIEISTYLCYQKRCNIFLLLSRISRSNVLTSFLSVLYVVHLTCVVSYSYVIRIYRGSSHNTNFISRKNSKVLLGEIFWNFKILTKIEKTRKMWNRVVQKPSVFSGFMSFTLRLFDSLKKLKE